MPQNPRHDPASQPEPLVPPWCSHMARVLLTLALVTTALLLPPAATDAEVDTADPRIERGRALYRLHCVNCHGDQGMGDGPMAKLLRSPVPDLSRLTARHEGEFPAEHVRQTIDGRFEIPSHGRREMPIWGLSFQERGRAVNQEREVQERLTALVEYLRSMQEE